MSQQNPLLTLTPVAPANDRPAMQGDDNWLSNDNIDIHSSLDSQVQKTSINHARTINSDSLVIAYENGHYALMQNGQSVSLNSGDHIQLGGQLFEVQISQTAETIAPAVDPLLDPLFAPTQTTPVISQRPAVHDVIAPANSIVPMTDNIESLDSLGFLYGNTPVSQPIASSHHLAPTPRNVTMIPELHQPVTLPRARTEHVNRDPFHDNNLDDLFNQPIIPEQAPADTFQGALASEPQSPRVRESNILEDLGISQQQYLPPSRTRDALDNANQSLNMNGNVRPIDMIDEFLQENDNNYSWQVEQQRLPHYPGPSQQRIAHAPQNGASNKWQQLKNKLFG